MFLRMILPAAVMTFLAISAAADEVLLRNGETIDGELSVTRIEIESAQGDVVIPAHHLDGMSRSDDGFVVTLIDGSTVEGRLRLEAIELRTGLVLRRIPIDEIEAVRIEISPEELVTSTLAGGGFVEVDRVPLDLGVVSAPCPLRLRLRLPSRFREGGWSSPQTRVVECDDVLTISTVEVRFRRGRRGA